MKQHGVQVKCRFRKNKNKDTWVGPCPSAQFLISFFTSVQWDWMLTKKSLSNCWKQNFSEHSVSIHRIFKNVSIDWKENVHPVLYLYIYRLNMLSWSMLSKDIIARSEFENKVWFFFPVIYLFLSIKCLIQLFKVSSNPPKILSITFWPHLGFPVNSSFNFFLAHTLNIFSLHVYF